MHSISNYIPRHMTESKNGYATDLLEGRTIMVTGGGRGIGRACVESLANCGASVIAVARTASDLEQLQVAQSGSIETWCMDIMSNDFLHRLESLDRLDGLLNNAGTNRVGLMTEQNDKDLDLVVDLNIKSVWKTSRAAIFPLTKGGNASIVNMSSQMGHVGSPRRTLYCMSKHAVEGLTKAMAVELAEQGVRVNSVAPTFVMTPLTEPMMEDQSFSEFVMGMIPGKKLATVAEVANACIYLLSDLSMSTTGSCLKVDGGWTAH
jgi:NAD(P)-dependent dehydrogenase (short-subunit alcohol dehydrogenase family)